MKIHIRRSMVATIAVAMALAMTAAPAFARGGSVSSGGGSAHISSGGSSGGRSTPAPAAKAQSSSGRSTKAPTNSGSGNSSNNASGGRSTKAPSKTGTNTPAPKSAPKTAPGPTIHASSPSKGAVTVSRSTRATGSSYSVGGHTYNYRTVNYYRGFGGGYPLYGTSAYWLLFNDPYYYPNYGLIGDPWYGHQYPVGYGVSNGQLVAVHHSSLAWLWVLLIIVLVAAAAVGIFLLVRARRAAGTFADKF